MDTVAQGCCLCWLSTTRGAGSWLRDGSRLSQQTQLLPHPSPYPAGGASAGASDCCHMALMCTQHDKSAYIGGDPAPPSYLHPFVRSRVGDIRCLHRGWSPTAAYPTPGLACWRWVRAPGLPSCWGRSPWGRGVGFAVPDGCSVLPGVTREHSGMLGSCGGPTLAGKAGGDSLPSPALPAGQLLPHPVLWLPPAPVPSPWQRPQAQVLQGAGRMLMGLAATCGGRPQAWGWRDSTLCGKGCNQSCSWATRHPLLPCSHALVWR